ncbi:MAG TPA: hypothetical protein VKE98_11655 [Gemmataceae bacterium]|nr:hypothetical protein [Gemmataceae bacterium]
MSIYATLWEIHLPQVDTGGEPCACVYAQAVPAHIGHPSHYPDGDPYADFLPPVVREYNPETDEAPWYRAVVIVQAGRNKKDIQRYVDPLLVLSGEEYARVPFQNLLDRIQEKIDWNIVQFPSEEDIPF